MIEAGNLRVGNLVKVLGKEVKVIGISKRSDRNLLAVHYAEFAEYSIPFKLFHLKPIEITREKLEQLGFKTLDKYTFTKDGLFVYHRKRGFVTGSKKREIKLNYLHELQNWFYINSNYKELKLC